MQNQGPLGCHEKYQSSLRGMKIALNPANLHALLVILHKSTLLHKTIENNKNIYEVLVFDHILYSACKS